MKNSINDIEVNYEDISSELENLVTEDLNDIEVDFDDISEQVEKLTAQELEITTNEDLELDQAEKLVTAKMIQNLINDPSYQEYHQEFKGDVLDYLDYVSDQYKQIQKLDTPDNHLISLNNFANDIKKVFPVHNDIGLNDISNRVIADNYINNIKDSSDFKEYVKEFQIDSEKLTPVDFLRSKIASNGLHEVEIKDLEKKFNTFVKSNR